MKDFPCFATDDGVASLILKEIPYRQEAYIRFQDVQPGRALFAGVRFLLPHGGSGEDICSGPRGIVAVSAARRRLRNAGKSVGGYEAAGKHLSGDGSHGGNMAKALQRADARR